MKRKFFSLLVAFAMVFATAVPASATFIATPSSEAVCSYVSDVPENATLLDLFSCLMTVEILPATMQTALFLLTAVLYGMAIISELTSLFINLVAHTM